MRLESEEVSERIMEDRSSEPKILGESLDGGAALDGGESFDGDGGAAPDGGESFDGDGGAAPDGDGGSLPEAEAKRRHSDGCADEEMHFEGRCMAKSKVKRILDERDRHAIEQVRSSKGAPKAKAYSDLLEQQVAQVEKTEDDLDEIIEILKEEKAAAEEKKEKAD